MSQKVPPSNCVDAPNSGAMDETWIIESHLVMSDQRAFSLFAHFNTLKINNKRYFYLTWSLVDVAQNIKYHHSEVDQHAPEIALNYLLAANSSIGEPFKNALVDVFKKNKVLLPNRIFKKKPHFDSHKLHLQFGDSQLIRNADGTYYLKLFSSENKIDCELVLSPKKPTFDYGHLKELTGQFGEKIHLTLLPNAELSGKIQIVDQTLGIDSGIANLNYEFIVDGTKILFDKANEFSINKLALHLDNNCDLFIYELIRKKNQESIEKVAIWVDVQGNVTSFTDFEVTPDLTPTNHWRSIVTFNTYPTSWKIEIPALKLNLILKANIPDQEVISLAERNLIYWKGACRAQGIIANISISGDAFITRYGFNTVTNVKEFFSSVGDEVRKQIEALLPLHPTLEEWRNLITTKTDEHLLDGVDFAELSRALLDPIRLITNRQGKAWRPYIALATCHVVGGDFTPYLPLLALELMHVGSLIVDDVQDRSPLRRGGPAAHCIYGEPLAINSGEEAYILPEIVFRKLFKDLPKNTVCEIYENYFDAIRSGHAGQALDIAGPKKIVKEIIAGGDGAKLESWLIAVHKLKSGVPAEIICRICGILGNGTKAQIDAVGAYVESIGIAFQIMDDVLNLRGFQKEFKIRGEDIMEGKITFPVAKAQKFLPKDKFIDLLKIIELKPQNPDQVTSIINELEQCGAIQASVDHAEQIVQSAWDTFDHLIDESFTKLMLRVFGKFVLKRHY